MQEKFQETGTGNAVMAKIETYLTTTKQPDKVVMSAFKYCRDKVDPNKTYWKREDLYKLMTEYSQYVLSECGLDKAITLLEDARTELLFHSGTAKIIESIETFLTNYKQLKK